MHYLLFYIQLHLTSDICVTEEKVPSGKGFNGMVRDYFFVKLLERIVLLKTFQDSLILGMVSLMSHVFISVDN